MASTIKRGESLFIPFQNGKSVQDSQLRPRVYRSVAAYEKNFPNGDTGDAPIELVEYAEVVHAHWYGCGTFYDEDGNLCFLVQCSRCGRFSRHYVCGDAEPYCHCGARMKEEEKG